MITKAKDIEIGDVLDGWVVTDKVDSERVEYWSDTAGTLPERIYLLKLENQKTGTVRDTWIPKDTAMNSESLREWMRQGNLSGWNWPNHNIVAPHGGLISLAVLFLLLALAMIGMNQ